MRIVRYQRGLESGHGVLEGETVYALDRDAGRPPRRGAALCSIGEITLLAPCVPRQLISLGANYADRCREKASPVPTELGLSSAFDVASQCIVGSEAPIRLPPWEAHVEYGAELGVVMERDCSGVPASRVREYILGYTCLNNVWAKTWPRVPGATDPRVYDSFCPVGPWIETDLDPHDLRLRLRLNGETRQDSRTSNMIFDVFTVVAYVSNRVPLAAGDVIMTASLSGIGLLAPGDTVEVEIEGIGVLRNPAVRDPSVPRRPLTRMAA